MQIKTCASKLQPSWTTTKEKKVNEIPPLSDLSCFVNMALCESDKQIFGTVEGTLATKLRVHTSLQSVRKRTAHSCTAFPVAL